jgi:hypothetical protein
MFKKERQQLNIFQIILLFNLKKEHYEHHLQSYSKDQSA